MKKITVDLTNIETPGGMHAYLAYVMDFPAYYGRNLDALHDILSGFNKTGAVTFHIINREKQSSRMVTLYQAMLDMLTDLGRENPNIGVVEE